MSTTRSALPSAILLVAAACTPSDDRSPSRTTADACRIAPEPAVSIGGIAPPDHIFGNVSDVSRLPNGQVAVADRQARNVTIFDERGKIVRTLGREGDGPGEFDDPIAIAPVDGTILVWDWDHLRATRFDLQSDDVEVYPAAILNPGHEFGDVGDGFVIGSDLVGRETDTEDFWDVRLRILHWTGTDTELDTLADIRERTSGWVDRDTRFTGSPIFGPRGTFTAGDGRVYWTEGDSALIHVWRNGEQSSIEWIWPTRRTAPADVEDWLDRQSERMRSFAKKTVDAMPVSETFPVVSDLVHDVDGGVWVGIYPTPADSMQTWLRFEAGEVACEVEIRRSFEPTEGGSDWLVGVTTDELDVERVEVRELAVGQPAVRGAGG